MAKTVLVIDDEEECAEVIGEILKDDYKVVLAYSAKEAREICQKKMPDLIITDLNMPNTTGLEFTHRLYEEGHDVPIIAISGYLNKDLALKAIDLGVYDYIQKPFQTNDVLDLVKKCLNHVSKKED